jgi:anti-sigma factor RsiW
MSEITKDLLMALADGQLDAAKRQDLERRLADRPELAADLAQMQRQSDAIRALYGPVISEPLPARLDAARIAASTREKRGRFWSNAVAAVVIAGLGIGAGWFLRDLSAGPGPADRLIASAVSAHTVYVGENRHSVEVPGDDSAHLTTWLSARLQTNLAMPDLISSGLTFLGGRLLPAPDVPGGRAAQLMYEDAAGERLTLYVTPALTVDAPTYQLATLGVDTALYWADDTLTCTITAPYTPEKLETIARSVFAQLSPRATDPAVYSP